jgi:arabinofuranosyltransferase
MTGTLFSRVKKNAPLLALMLVSAGLAGLTMQRPFPPYVDDAFIYLRFARNISNGLGAVWNAGEPPVEGFTSPLYELLLVVLSQLGVTNVWLGAWLGIAANAATLWLVWRLANLLNPDHGTDSFFTLVFLALSPSFIFWTTSGMETLLYTTLLVAAASALISFWRQRVRAWLPGALFALAALARPEAAPLFCLTLIFELCRRLRQRERLLDRDILLMGAAFLLIYAPAFAWRYWYFGYPFPNTYYAKTGGSLVQVKGGIIYLLQTLLYAFGGSASVLPLLLLFVSKRPPSAVPAFYLAFLTFVSWLIVAANGGDHFLDARFITPTLPFVFLLIGIGMSRLMDSQAVARRLRLSFRIIVLLLAMAHWAQNQPYRDVVSGWQRWRNHKAGDLPQAGVAAPRSFPWEIGFALMGRSLAATALPTESIAAVPVGALGYYSKMVVIDMVGVVDPVIAHEQFDPAYTATWRPGHDKGDGAYVLSRHPDYVQLTDYLTPEPEATPGEHSLQYKSIVELWSSRQFHCEYEFHPLKTEGGWYYNLYRRIRTPARQCPSDISSSVA